MLSVSCYHWAIMTTAEPLAILWEDPHLLVVNKPAGLLTQGLAGGAPTLEEAVRRHLRPDDPDSIYVGTVHRLDRPVSGVIVWAKTLKAARRLSAQFAARQAKKEYWAVAEGRLVGTSTWDDWLGPVDEAGVARVVPAGTPGARRAITRVRPLVGARVPAGLTALILEPDTGRTHQLRVQAKARGLPILGDTRYDATRPFSNGIALHARSLTFAHPLSRRELSVVAALPKAWSDDGLAMPIR